MPTFRQVVKFWVLSFLMFVSIAAFAYFIAYLASFFIPQTIYDIPAYPQTAEALLWMQ